MLAFVMTTGGDYLPRDDGASIWTEKHSTSIQCMLKYVLLILYKSMSHTLYIIILDPLL